jgi:hypothetical protein
MRLVYPLATDYYSQTETSYLLTTLSGNLVIYIDQKDAEEFNKLITASGDIVSWVLYKNYVTYDQLTSTSGSLITWVSTVSGDITSQIPSLSGYATQTWVTNQDYITPARLTTVSGDIVAQIRAEQGVSSFITTWSMDLTNDGAFDWANSSCRTVIDGSLISTSGSYVRLTLEAKSNGNNSFDHIAIVERDGDTPDGVTTPTEVTFYGYSGLYLVAGHEAQSDWIPFEISPGRDYLVILDCSSLSQQSRYKPLGGVGYRKVGDTWNTASFGTPISTDTTLYWVNKIEVDSPVAATVTQAQLTSTSGYLITFINTVSGIIVGQIPSLSGYATQTWVTEQSYVTSQYLTTVSANIVSQIPPTITLEGTGGIGVSNVGNTWYIDGSSISGTASSGTGNVNLQGLCGLDVYQAGDIWYIDPCALTIPATVSGVTLSGTGGLVCTFYPDPTVSGNGYWVIDGSGVSGSPSVGGNTSTLSGIAGETLVKYDVVYQSVVDGNFYKAIHSGDSYQADAIGLVSDTSVASGVGVGILVDGPLENLSWSWTPGRDLYVGATTGSLTMDPPTTSGYFVKPVAQAVTSTQVWIHPELGWRVNGIYDTVVLTPQQGPKGDTGPTGAASTVPGPQGAPGPQVTYISINGVAGETLSQYDVVYQDWADSGRFKKAVCSDSAKTDARGIVTKVGGISSGLSGEITLWGQVTYSGGSSGLPLFLSTTSGQMMSTAPTTDGYYAKPLGSCLTTSGIWFQPELGWIVYNSNGSKYPTILTGTQTSRPSATTNSGSLYMPTDGYYPAISNGSSWDAYSPFGFKCSNPPMANTFSNYNPQSNVTLTDISGGGLRLTHVGPYSANVGFTKSLPGTPWSIVVGIKIETLPVSSYQMLGIGLTDGTKLALFGVGYRSTSITDLNIYCPIFYSDPSTYSSASYNTCKTYTGMSNPTLFFLRIYNNGVMRYFDVSWDGINWNNINADSVATFLTPTSAGLFSYDSGGSVTMNMNIFHWSLG